MALEQPVSSIWPILSPPALLEGSARSAARNMARSLRWGDVFGVFNESPQGHKLDYQSGQMAMMAIVVQNNQVVRKNLAVTAALVNKADSLKQDDLLKEFDVLSFSLPGLVVRCASIQLVDLEQHFDPAIEIRRDLPAELYQILREKVQLYLSPKYSGNRKL